MDINEKIHYIIDLAKEYEEYFKNEEALFRRINRLTKEDIKPLIQIYKDTFYSDGQLSPVTLIRHLLLTKLLNGEKITAGLIEEIKKKFCSKDIEYFSPYQQKVITAIENYHLGPRSPFSTWKNPYRILYVFLFYGKVKITVNKYLDEIGSHIIDAVRLKDFKVHNVNFDGSTNYGQSFCWMAFFPEYKIKHTNAYQLFLSFQSTGLHYGKWPGSEVKRRNPDIEAEEFDVSLNIEDVISTFKAEKEEIIIQNKTMKQFWKYSPGMNAIYWDEMKEKKIMAIGWDEIGDINQYPTREDIAEALGVSESSNQSWNMDLFRSASIGDIIIANKGRKEVVGIGIIDGEYEYRPKRKYFQKVRRVNWIITNPVKLDKNIFRADTFSTTLKYSEIKDAYLNKYPELEKIFNRIDKGIKLPESQPGADAVNYYWLNANPKIWSFLDYDIGDTQTYTAFNSKRNKRRKYQYFLDANPGDLVIGYLSTPIKQITAILEVTKSLFQDDIEGEVIEFKINEFLETPIDYEILKSNDELRHAEPIVNNQGSLFKLSDEEYNVIQNIIEEFNPPTPEPDEFTIEQAIHESGLSEQEFKEILGIIRENKQVILQGAPGTGKTYLAKILARYMAQGDANVEIIQFHPSYSYEDFVEGYRPAEDGRLYLKNGIFKELCRKATINKNKKYILIIDEINRGNISKIFGELIYLLEYRNEKVRLTYTPEITFSIPENLYIIGTMNLADRSLALMDYALRRRFQFHDLETDYNLIKKFSKDSELDINTIIKNITEINEIIANTHSLGKDFIIGHSYFLGKLRNKNTMELLWKYEIRPLLLEYYFDNISEVNNLQDIFFRNV